MRVLAAEDDPVTLSLLEALLNKWGYETVKCRDGREAWDILQQDNAPRIVLLDWMIPEMDGVTVCRHIRSLVGRQYTYIILLTRKRTKDDIVKGLKVGADDYIVKPFDPRELRLRIETGRRILDLQSELTDANRRLEAVNGELAQALAHVKQLREGV